MGHALSSDLRERVLKASEGGISVRKCAERLCVAASTAIRWIDRAGKGETVLHKPTRRASCLDTYTDFIDTMIEEYKVTTLDEMVVRLVDERDVRIGQSKLSKRLCSRGFTFKKRLRMHWRRSAQAC